MKKTIKRISNHHHTRTTVKYGIVSVIATIIDFFILNGGIKLFQLTPQVAKTLAFLTATVAVFRLQQRWVFRADPETASRKQLLQYFVASVAGFLASQGAITVSNTVWPGNLLYINLANFIGFGSVWVAKLLFFRFVVFKPRDEAQSMVGGRPLPPQPSLEGASEVEALFTERVLENGGKVPGSKVSAP